MTGTACYSGEGYENDMNVKNGCLILLRLYECMPEGLSDPVRLMSQGMGEEKWYSDKSPSYIRDFRV